MQTTNDDQSATRTGRHPKASTTLNRKYVSRPRYSGDIKVAVKKSPKVVHFSNEIKSPTSNAAQSKEKVVPLAIQKTVNARLKARSDNSAAEQPKLSAKELKEQAIKKALATASSVTPEEKTEKKEKLHFGFGRLALALGCAAVAVFAIVYFVNLNMPDISLKVAAMQTGINASYPSYVPRDYGISSITSENGKITLNFKNSITGDSFSLVEEASSWDSNALLSNYVKGAFKDNYTVIREQGLTIYISNDSAAWVNGGVVYKINVENGELTNKQIKSIAVSL